jgi:hypothetical protein
MRFTTIIRFALIAMATTACATSFTGSAHVDDGRAGCERKCKGQGMEVAGMVYMGEYSDACVCSVPGQTGSRNKLKFLASAGGAVAGAAAGVVMQMRAQEQQQQHN